MTCKALSLWIGVVGSTAVGGCAQQESWDRDTYAPMYEESAQPRAHANGPLASGGSNPRRATEADTPDRFVPLGPAPRDSGYVTPGLSGGAMPQPLYVPPADWYEDDDRYSDDYYDDHPIYIGPRPRYYDRDHYYHRRDSWRRHRPGYIPRRDHDHRDWHGDDDGKKGGSPGVHPDRGEPNDGTDKGGREERHQREIQDATERAQRNAQVLTERAERRAAEERQRQERQQAEQAAREQRRAAREAESASDRQIAEQRRADREAQQAAERQTREQRRAEQQSTSADDGDGGQKMPRYSRQRRD